jgi:hypothetical protein
MPYENQIIKIKDIYSISKLPKELLLIILQYLILPIRRRNNIYLSNQPYIEFKKYDPGTINDEINWDKYRIGNCIIVRGKTSRAWRPKNVYIRSWCSECTEPTNNELNENYFEFASKYLCKDCKHNDYKAFTCIYKICINCFECFRYKKPDDKFCNSCLNVNILDYYKFLLRYSIFLSCEDCKDILPKLCKNHHNKKILYKYSELFKSCKFCIKWTPQNCKIHQYYFK